MSTYSLKAIIVANNTRVYIYTNLNFIIIFIYLFFYFFAARHKRAIHAQRNNRSTQFNVEFQSATIVRAQVQ